MIDKRKVQSLKFLFLSFGFAFFVLCFTFNSFAQDKIVAIVNNDIITHKDLNDFSNFMRVQLSQEYSGKELESQLQSKKSGLINKLIEDRLILQEAKRYGVIVDENRIKARLDEMRRRYPTELDFQDSLRSQGLVQGDLEAKIREQFLIFNMIEYKIRRNITVAPTEVTNFYENNIQDFKATEERNIASLNTDDENIARKAYEDLKANKSLDSVINEYSLSSDKLISAREGELRKDIEDVIFKLNVGEFCKPLKINDSHYIFKLESITAPRQLSLSEARDNIYTYLFNKKIEEELSKWLEELKKRSYIKYTQD
ncbi:MAG: peptidylprolyl isomerase [Candidatus Omnitrophota bacterium]